MNYYPVKKRKDSRANESTKQRIVVPSIFPSFPNEKSEIKRARREKKEISPPRIKLNKERAEKGKRFKESKRATIIPSIFPSRKRG